MIHGVVFSKFTKNNLVKVLAAACIAVGMAFGQAAIEGTSLTWKLEDGTLTISGTGVMPTYGSNTPWYSQRGDITSVVIQNGVGTIGDWAFYDSRGLTAVNIGNSVSSIGDNAFFGCTELTAINVDEGNANYVSTDGVLFDKAKTTLIIYPVAKTGTTYTIPNSVTSIGDGAFQNCTGLTAVNIPNSVTSIGVYAFAYCTGLTAVNIPNSVTSIGDVAFQNCTGLTAVNISNSVTSIGVYAFAYCTGLTAVNIPNSVTSIGDGAFANCTGLTAVNIPNSVTSIGDAAFYYCTELTAVNIPNSVTSIGNGAFYYCTGLTAVNIPNSVTSIGNDAFYYCTGLKQIINRNATPQTITAGVFEYVPAANVKLFVPASVLDQYKAAPVWSNFSAQTAAIPFTLKDEIAVGETLTAKFDEAANYEGAKVITWASGNTAVVIENGKITAGASNNAAITATLDGDYFSDFYFVNVIKGKVEKPSVTAANLVYDKTEKSAGIAANALYTITGDTATNAGQHTATVALKDKDNYEWADGKSDDLPLTWTIAKAAGATVLTPTLASKTHNSITINAIVAASGQVVNYAINTANTAPTDATAWKTDLTFAGLSANTDYYIFARAIENANYHAGAVSASLEETTNAASNNQNPIREIQKSDGRTGIRLSKNIVSDKAEFEIILPSDKVLEVKAVIYDNTGNVVFEFSGRDAKLSWNLTNNADRNVANGTYLIIVEAKGVNGNYAYSAKVGVKK